MSHESVYRAVSSVVQCRHVDWFDNDMQGAAPAPPFACYLLDYEQPIGADDAQVACKRRWIVELYEKRRDKALEMRLGDALREQFGTVRRDENWIGNDNLLQVVYTFYEIEGDYDG